MNHKLSCNYHDGRGCNCTPYCIYPRRTPLQLRLARMRACREARQWAAHRDAYEMWDECENGAWMLWLASELGVGRDGVIAVLDWLQAQLCCIRADIPAALAALPDPDRQIVLLETAQHVRGQISSGEIARKLGL